MPARASQPNILLVFSDQHRWCDLGCSGNPEVRSPHLDAFARRAVRATSCISNAPLCVPSRGTLLTGLYPLRHGAVSNDLPLRPDVTTIGAALAGAGYDTGYIGKWHLAGVPRDRCIPAGPGRFGFATWKVCNCSHAYMDAYYYDEADRRIPIEGYEPVAQTDLAIDFIRRQRDRPWALVLSWGPPHDPYFAVPDRYLQEYASRDLHLRPNVPETDGLAAPEHRSPEASFAAREHRSPEASFAAREHRSPQASFAAREHRSPQGSLARRLSREQVTRNYRGYYAHITALDEQFGRLTAALAASGQAEDTIVVYTSDHGDMLGSQGLTNKQLPYEESVRVPLLVSWPGHTRVGTSDGLIGLVDLPVSLLGLAGVDLPGKPDGLDLHALFVDPAARGREECYIFDLIPCHQAAARGGTEWRGVRTRRHTFARSAGDGGFALFDNERDPFQLHNLVDDPAHAALREELRGRCAALTAAHDALLPWEELVRRYGLLEEWNRSQAYFRLPLLG